jgi:hypothetical protein
MNNWKDYVAFQQVQNLKEDGSAYVFMLTKIKHRKSQSPSDSIIGYELSIIKEKCVHTLEESEVGEEVERLISTFTETADDIHKAQVGVAVRSGRHAANKTWNNVVFYKSEVSAFDSAIFVSEYQGKYAVVPNNNFQDYGCKVV